MNDEFMTNLQKSASDLVKLAGMECFHAPDGVCSGCLALAMEEVDIKFNVFAQDTQEWEGFNQFVPGMTIYSAKPDPVIIRGLFYDRPFMFVKMDSEIILTVGAKGGKEPYDIKDCEYQSVIVLMGDFVSSAKWEELLLTGTFNLSRCETVYEFKAYAVDITDPRNMKKTNRIVKEVSRGHSPYEAYTRIYKSIHDHYSKMGWNNKQINDYYEKTRVQPDDWDVVGIDKTELPLTLDLGTNVPDSWKPAPNVVKIPDEDWNEG